MIENKKCFVGLNGISDSERIIFKLICSVSARTKGRDIHYVLVAEDQLNKAHLLIHGPDGSEGKVGIAGSAYRISLATRDQTESQTAWRELVKPLIATRVLSALDEVIGTAEIDFETAYTDMSFQSQGGVSIQEEQETESLDKQDTLRFDLTEQEASELAIVHDEALGNPANLGEGYQRDIKTADVTPIRGKESYSLTHHGVSLFCEDGGSESTKSPTARALVVDDSPSVRKQLELELELFDVDVDYAATASEAFEKLAEQNYDVAFLDVVLPDKDGFSICRHIKETAKDTSVIMLTGKAKQSDKVKGALAGCDAYMVKPVGRLTFQSTVRNYLTLMDNSSVVEM